MLQMQRRGLVVCLNPHQVTGRLYCLTDAGHAAVSSAFALTLPGIVEDVDWKKYSFVIRAKVRRLVLTTLAMLEVHTDLPQTATMIRKRLKDEHAIGLNSVIRAVNDLMRMDLIHQVGVTDERCCKLYRLTPSGRAIAKQLHQ